MMKRVRAIVCLAMHCLSVADVFAQCLSVAELFAQYLTRLSVRKLIGIACCKLINFELI